MKINVGNIKKMSETISEVQSLSRVRNIDSVKVIHMVEGLEKRLVTYGIPKKDWVGMQFKLNYNSQTFPKAYKYTPDATIVTVERSSSGWFVTDIQRSYCSNKTYTLVSDLNQNHVNSLVKNFKDFP